MDDGQRQLSLPEELLLVAVDPYTGEMRMPARVPHGIAGAVLAKLLAAGRVWPLRNGRVHARDTAPSGDALLDRLVAELAEPVDPDGRPRGRDAHRWLREIGLRVAGPYLERLTARGVLAVVEQPNGELFRSVRYPLLMPEVAATAFGRIDQAVRSPVPPDPRAVLLTALAAAIRLDGCFYPQRGDAPLRHRMCQFVTAYPVARAVLDLVLTDEAAELHRLRW